VEAAAQSFGAKTKTITNVADTDNDIYTATWVLLYRPGMPSSGTDDDAALPHSSRSNVVVRPWTDDYSNLFQLLR
jgi:hypothetical protein